MDDRKSTGSTAETTATPGGGAQGRIGYCQECGCSLTTASLQRVGNGVFCLPCSAQRRGVNGWQGVNSGPYTAGRPSGTVPQPAGAPNPVLAGILGLIPGVGAMYNGQYAKGAMHLIVFVVLVSLADNLNWVFYWLVWGWVFYQAFDAYHTARARRDGLPLPNSFGWNDLGERLGFNRPTTPPPAGYPSTGTYPDIPAESVPNWAGYVAPTAGQAPYSSPAPSSQPQSAYTPPPQPFSEDNPYTAPYTPPPVPPVKPGPIPVTSLPYVPTYTGPLQGRPTGTPVPGTSSRRFPVGALWLIGLGVLFLIGNLLPEWRVSGRWLVPILLAALASWSAFRRWEQYRSTAAVTVSAPSLAGAMSGPVILFTVAFLLALQAGYVLPLHRSWPVLLVVWGSMLLIQRAAPPTLPHIQAEISEPAPPATIRSTSGTGSLGL